MRERVLAAALVCVVRRGLAATTAQDIAVEAGVGRATLYRHFRGGRDEILGELVAQQQAAFFGALRDAVSSRPDLRGVLVEGLRTARRQLDAHEVFQKQLVEAPGQLLPLFTISSDRIRSGVARFFAPYLAPLVPAGVDLAWAADELARLTLSFIATSGSFDLDDGAVLDALVDGPFLAWCGPPASR